MDGLKDLDEFLWLLLVKNLYKDVENGNSE